MKWAGTLVTFGADHTRTKNQLRDDNQRKRNVRMKHPTDTANTRIENWKPAVYYTTSCVMGDGFHFERDNFIWWRRSMFYGYFCAHDRLNGPSDFRSYRSNVKDETPFRYGHAEIRTQVVVIFNRTRYKLEHGGVIRCMLTDKRNKDLNIYTHNRVLS